LKQVLLSWIFLALVINIFALPDAVVSEQEAHGGYQSPLSAQQSYLQTFEVRKDSLSYAIKLRIPNLDIVNVPDSKRLWIRGELKKLLRDVRKKFISDVRAWTKVQVVRGRDLLPRLNGDCKLGLFDSSLVSIQCDFQSEPSDSAPMHFTKALNLDLLHQRSIALSDIFGPDILGEHNLKQALTQISAYTREVLNNTLQEDECSPGISDWIRSGTEPTLDNFSTFAIYKDGLKFFFPEYQVAAYASGPHEVLIPWSALKGLKLKSAVATPRTADISEIPLYV